MSIMVRSMCLHHVRSMCVHHGVDERVSSVVLISLHVWIWPLVLTTEHLYVTWSLNCVHLIGLSEADPQFL